MNIVASDNYRTKDGKAYFAFSFFKEEEFVIVDVTFASTPVILANNPLACSPSKRGGFTIISEDKARDLFTARLIAGQWAEGLWKKQAENLDNKTLMLTFSKKDK